MSISLDSFDWDGNAAWQQYLCNVNYPGSDEAAQAYFLDKIKRSKTLTKQRQNELFRLMNQ